MYYPNGQENNWRKKTRPNDEIWIDFIRKKKTGPDDSSLHVPVFVLRQNLDWGFGIEEKTSDFFDILVCYGGTSAYLRRQGRRCQLLNGIPKIWIKRYKISIKLINNESITSELFGCPLRGDPAGRRLRYWALQSLLGCGWFAPSPRHCISLFAGWGAGRSSREEFRAEQQYRPFP